MTTTLIILKGSHPAVIDADDLGKLARFTSWYCIRQSHVYYAVGYDKAIKKTAFMHRIIMDAPKGMHVHHVNGNG